jgi:uncharacterized peroxidase-related enzyme
MEKIISLPLLDESTDNLEAKKLLTSTKAKMGFIPNIFAMMANSPGLLETYFLGDAKFREISSLTAVEQEIVYLSISLENTCNYCMAAHSTIAHNKSKVPAEILEAIRKNQEIPDQKLNALSTFTKALVAQRGRPAPHVIQDFLAQGYEQSHMLAIILAVSTKTMSNYVNHLAELPVDEAFKNFEWNA